MRIETSDGASTVSPATKAVNEKSQGTPAAPKTPRVYLPCRPANTPPLSPAQTLLSLIAEAAPCAVPTGFLIQTCAAWEPSIVRRAVDRLARSGRIIQSEGGSADDESRWKLPDPGASPVEPPLPAAPEPAANMTDEAISRLLGTPEVRIILARVEQLIESRLSSPPAPAFKVLLTLADEDDELCLWHELPFVPVVGMFISLHGDYCQVEDVYWNGRAEERGGPSNCFECSVTAPRKQDREKHLQEGWKLQGTIEY